MKKFHITVNGNAYEVEVEEIGAVASSAPAPVAAPAAPVAAPAAPVVAAPTGGTVITCPMPGTIIDIKVSAGQAVSEGQVLVIFEAMKEADVDDVKIDPSDLCDKITAVLQDGFKYEGVTGVMTWDKNGAAVKTPVTIEIK